MRLAGMLLVAACSAHAADVPPTVTLDARLLAVGVEGAAGVRQVGYFHPGSPVSHLTGFAAYTRPGRVLDPRRLLVTSTANYGASPAQANLPPGSILSLATHLSQPLVVPARFALAGGQASALNGAVQVYTANNAAFVNRRQNPNAITALLPAVSNPRYISVNNAFGRPWFANAPDGIDGPGSSTVTDPNGTPLANPPSVVAGGVFADARTNRVGQRIPGNLLRGAVGTAFLGPSPDGSGFAVFAVAKTDGSLVQVHVRDGVDGLAPPGTLTSLSSSRQQNARLPGAGLIGMAFNWTPQRVLYVADGARDRIVGLTLGDDTQVLKVSGRRDIMAPQLNQPVDLAPAIPETANPHFSTLTTLSGQADLYVANRGDGRVLRVSQTGTVLASADLRLPDGQRVGPGRLTGMAVSADAQRLWLTLAGDSPNYPGRDGLVIEIPAFDAQGAFQPAGRYRAELATLDPAQVGRGQALFHKDFTEADGLGPLFNQTSCVACHNEPTPGGSGLGIDTQGLRVGHLDNASGRFDALLQSGGPVARRHAVAGDTRAHTGPPRRANVTSVRSAPALYGVALIDRIQDQAILAHAVDKGDGIHGRANLVTDANGRTRVGRFGWKADVAGLDVMIATAFTHEMGITSTLLREGDGAPAELDDQVITDLAVFLRTLPLPEPRDVTP